MLNVVLFEPEIPQNTGNIMRTCVATNAHLHLIKPLGFYMDEAHIKRSGVNYVNECQYTIYENFTDFLNKNEAEMYYFTRYGKKAHTEFDYKNFVDSAIGIEWELGTPIADNLVRNSYNEFNSLYDSILAKCANGKYNKEVLYTIIENWFNVYSNYYK